VRGLDNVLGLCHHGPNELAAWNGQLTLALGKLIGQPVLLGVGNRADFSVVHLEDPSKLLTPAASWDVPSSITRVAQGIYPLSHEKLFGLVYRTTRVSRGTTQVKRLIGAVENPSSVVRRFLPGFDDDFGIHAVSRSFRLTVCVPLRGDDRGPLQARERMRLQRHILGGFASRVGPAWDKSAALIDARGRASGSAATFDSLARLVPDLARQGAQELQRRVASEEGERLWDELWRGGWSVAEIEEKDGRRYLLIRRSNEDEPRLSRAEVAALDRARRGLPLKVIASELGLSIAAVSTQIHSGLAKLGLTHRIQLQKLV
jgi:DNA-binding CsgD family transcriptional regulator